MGLVIDLPLTCLRNSQGVYSVPKRFTNDETNGGSNSTTGGTGIDCPGQVTHPFSLGGSTGDSNNSTTTTTTASGINNVGGNSDNKNTGARTAAIVGGVVGAVLLLGLLFILFRRRNKNKRGRYNKPGFEGTQDLGHSASGGFMVHDADAIPTPFLAPYYMNASSSRGQTGVASENMDPKRRKIAMAARERSDPTQGLEHQGAGGLIELPPAYLDVPTQLS